MTPPNRRAFSYPVTGKTSSKRCHGPDNTKAFNTEKIDSMKIVYVKKIHKENNLSIKETLSPGGENCIINPGMCLALLLYVNKMQILP